MAGDPGGRGDRVDSTRWQSCQIRLSACARPRAADQTPGDLRAASSRLADAGDAPVFAASVALRMFPCILRILALLAVLRRPAILLCGRAVASVPSGLLSRLRFAFAECYTSGFLAHTHMCLNECDRGVLLVTDVNSYLGTTSPDLVLDLLIRVRRLTAGKLGRIREA